MVTLAAAVMARATAMAALRATALANVMVVGGSDKYGCRNSRGDVGGNCCGEGNGVGDDSSNCGGNGDDDGCNGFGVNGGICGVGNAATKCMKTMTTM
jgi:hypothetical protein